MLWQHIPVLDAAVDTDVTYGNTGNLWLLVCRKSCLKDILLAFLKVG